jgi:hypothetical protein
MCKRKTSARISHVSCHCLVYFAAPCDPERTVKWSNSTSSNHHLPFLLFVGRHVHLLSNCGHGPCIPLACRRKQNKFHKHGPFNRLGRWTTFKIIVLNSDRFMAVPLTMLSPKVFVIFSCRLKRNRMTGFKPRM